MMRSWHEPGCRSPLELISSRGEDFWPRPGRVFVAARSHTFAALAEAINAGFGRWDLNHLSQFDLADGTMIANTDQLFDASEDTVEIATAKLSTLTLGDQFAYSFAFSDDWHHLCTVRPERVDPEKVSGITPNRPFPYWGWGSPPDQHGRRFAEDSGEGPISPDPGGRDLPTFFPPWRWRAE